MTAYEWGYFIGEFIAYLVIMYIICFILSFIIVSIYYVIKRPNKPLSTFVITFNKWFVTVSIILLILNILNRIYQNQILESSHIYPKKFVEEFVNGCTSTFNTRIGQINSNIAKKSCTCTITEIQNTYTFGKFKEILQEQEKGKGIPFYIKDIITSCIEKK